MAIATARITTLAIAIVTKINTDLAISTNFPGVSTVRGVSFGFTDSELSKLRIVVRPDDYEGENGNGNQIDQVYKIEIGVLKKVNKTTAQTDPLIDLICAIARLFPKQSSFPIATGEDALIDDNRFNMFYLRNPDTMDSDEASVKFDSRLLLTFRELGRAKSEAT